MRLLLELFKKFSLPILLIMLLVGFASVGMSIYLKATKKSNYDVLPPIDIQWQFEGVLGTVDKQSAQRGYQVYKEVCAACHAMKRIPFRTLSDIGFSEAEIKTLAASFQVEDGPNDDGDMFERPGRPSDVFPSPFANEKQARAANGGAYPPDLSLMIKARVNGADYVYSLLAGYDENIPAEIEMGEGMHYNPYFPGKQIAMMAPLMDDMIEYSDGTPATVDQMSRDLVNFLQWAAEPEMERRKEMGLKVLIFTLIFTVLFYFAKVAIWSKAHKES